MKTNNNDLLLVLDHRLNVIVFYNAKFRQIMKLFR